MTDDDDARIRALLAGLGSGASDERMPPEVAARLEATLADLVAEREQGADVTTVVPLRRRWVSRATAAAAAVIVLGVGGAALTQSGLLDGRDAPSESSSAGGSTADRSESAPQAQSEAPTPTDDQTKAGDLAAVAALPVVSSASFDSDAARALAATGVPRSEASSDSTKNFESARKARERSSLALSTTGCSGPPLPSGATRLGVRYAGTLAVLVVHPPADGGRLVEAWSCAGDQVLDSVTVPTSGADPGLASPSPSP